MEPLRNPRHERFCLALAEGHSIAESYALAGYSKNSGNACRLNGNERIQARVAELQAHAAAKTAVTLEVILAELADAAVVAKSRGQAQALVSAAMGRAKLAGLLVERIEHGAPGDFDNCPTIASIADRMLERATENFAPIDQADRQAFHDLIDRHLKEQEEFLDAIKARPIAAERVDVKNLQADWTQLKPYSPPRISKGNGTKPVRP